MIDIRLEDGSRLTAILPPLAVNGPTFTIRKFSREVLNLHDLVVRGTINAGIAAFLELAVETNRNIIISGEKNSGITTTLNALTNLIPSHERLITIEEVVELQFNQGNIVQLESQPINPLQNGVSSLAIALVLACSSAKQKSENSSSINPMVSS